jgi:two-component system chemotaxis response regulator CheY
LATILVIEDNSEIRNVLCVMLEKAGHEVRDSLNGEEGIEKYREWQADLVMTDLFMPKKAGIETISELMEINPEVKIVAMTAHGTEEQYDFLRVAEALGAVATLDKPFSNKELLDIVEAARAG